MTSPNFNPMLVSKLLNFAGHASTGDNEALIAIRKAGSHAAAAKKTLGEMMVVESDLFFEIATLPNKDYLAKIADMKLAGEKSAKEIASLKAQVSSAVETVKSLQEVVTKAEGEIVALTAANASLVEETVFLKAENVTLVEKLADREKAIAEQAKITVIKVPKTTVSSERYNELRRAVLAHHNVGVPNWKDYYKVQTGTSDAEMNQWQKIGTIPDEAFELILSMEKVFKPKPSSLWSHQENILFRELLKKGDTSIVIAEKMTAQFGRHFKREHISAKRRVYRSN